MGNTPSTSAQPDASQADGIQEVLNVWASLKLKDQPNAQPDAVIVTGPDLSSPLEEINRPAAQAVYTPIKENEFRIVTIQPGSDDDPIRCNLSVVEDDHVPEYQALSYVCKCTVMLAVHLGTDFPEKGEAKRIRKQFTSMTRRGRSQRICLQL
jgi:hypothetical protein